MPSIRRLDSLQRLKQEIRVERSGVAVRRHVIAGLVVAEISEGRRHVAEERHPAAAIEQQHLVEQLEQLRARLVRDDEENAAVQRSIFQHFDHVERVARGESRGRFVEQEDFVVAQQLESDVQPLALAAAQRLVERPAGAHVATLAQADFAQRLAHHRLDPVRRLGRHAQPRGVFEVLADRQVLEKQIVLRHEADARLEPRVAMQLRAVDAHGSARRLGRAGEDAQQGGFAGAARAEDADQIAALRLEGHLVDADRSIGKVVGQAIGRKILDAGRVAADDIPIHLQAEARESQALAVGQRLALGKGMTVAQQPMRTVTLRELKSAAGPAPDLGPPAPALAIGHVDVRVRLV